MQKKYREPRKTAIVLKTAIVFDPSTGEPNYKKEEGRRKKEEERINEPQRHKGTKEEGRRSNKINGWGH
jgi:hypothetical protein